jgi:hypothetical protein
MNTNSQYANNKLPPKIKFPDFVSQMNDTHLKYDIEIKCCSDDSSDKILTVDTLVDIIFVNVDIDNTNEEWVNNFKLGETCLINVYINKYAYKINNLINKIKE